MRMDFQSMWSLFAEFLMLPEVDLLILRVEVFPRDIAILSHHHSDLRDKKRRGVAEVLSLEEEVEVTREHNNVAIWQCDGQVLNQSVVSLASGGEMEQELLVVVILTLPDV